MNQYRGCGGGGECVNGNVKKPYSTEQVYASSCMYYIWCVRGKQIQSYCTMYVFVEYIIVSYLTTRTQNTPPASFVSAVGDVFVKSKAIGVCPYIIYVCVVYISGAVWRWCDIDWESCAVISVRTIQKCVFV